MGRKHREMTSFQKSRWHLLQVWSLMTVEEEDCTLCSLESSSIQTQALVSGTELLVFIAITLDWRHGVNPMPQQASRSLLLRDVGLPGTDRAVPRTQGSVSEE